MTIPIKRVGVTFHVSIYVQFLIPIHENRNKNYTPHSEQAPIEPNSKAHTFAASP